MLDAAVLGELERATTAPLTVDITTTGRRSGELRRIEIWILKVGDRVVIGGTPGRRDWFANLSSDPNLVLHLKGPVVADIPAVARPITDPVVRSDIWNHASARWYRERTPVADLVAYAPTVELSFI